MPNRLTKSIKKLFQGQKVAAATQTYGPSKETALRRLQLVLVQDRIGLSPEILEAMKNDLLSAISKYVLIQRDSIEMQITRSGDSVILVSNIRVADVRKPANEPQ